MACFKFLHFKKMNHGRASYTALFLLLLFSCTKYVYGELFFIYNVNRHGARNILKKSDTLSEVVEFGGPALLAQGMSQCYNVGLSFRQRYLNLTSCSATNTCLKRSVVTNYPDNMDYGVTGIPGVAFTNVDVLIRSSAIDRSLTSARSFYTGVFPIGNTTISGLPSLEEPVPIYSTNDTNDVLVRAYTKCPAYDNILLNWYNSSQFKNMSTQSATLRSTIQNSYLLGYDTSLQNWWNIYDAFNTYMTYGVGDPVPILPTVLYNQVQTLANWLETAKMNSSLTGNLLGAFLLGDLMYYMNSAVAANENDNIYTRLLTISGHYNTQLSLLSALKWDKVSGNTHTWLTAIPKTAASLYFELHNVSSVLYVRVVTQNGPGADFVAVPLACNSAAAIAVLGNGTCLFTDFITLVGEDAMSMDEWCEACQNNSTDYCQAYWFSQAAAAAASNVRVDCGGPTKDGWRAAVGVLAGAAGILLIATVVLSVLLARAKQFPSLRSAEASQVYVMNDSKP